MRSMNRRLQASERVIKISFGNFIIFVSLLPFFSIIFCVVWSLLFFFEGTTWTDCQSENFLPSISAAVGLYQPQRFVFQMGVCLALIPRFIMIVMYYRLYERNIITTSRHLAYLVCLFLALENCALVGIAFVTSVVNYELHRNFLIIFVTISELYMLFTYILNRNFWKLKMYSMIEKSLEAKKLLFFTNFSAFVTAAYLFHRHSVYCEPGVYSMFALFEYIMMLTNMGFHMTTYWDFYGQIFIFDRRRGIYLLDILNY